MKNAVNVTHLSSSAWTGFYGNEKFLIKKNPTAIYIQNLTVALWARYIYLEKVFFGWLFKIEENLSGHFFKVVFNWLKKKTNPTVDAYRKTDVLEVLGFLCQHRQQTLPFFDSKRRGQQVCLLVFWPHYMKLQTVALFCQHHAVILWKPKPFLKWRVYFCCTVVQSMQRYFHSL